MSKNRPQYACQQCSARFPKWLGRCPDCGEWNSIVEEAALPSASVLTFSRSAGPPGGALHSGPPGAGQPRSGSPGSGLDGDPARGTMSGTAQPLGGRERESPLTRIPTGLPEVDRVLGGGLLEGSVALLGGDPGIGKSTLVLQMLDGVGARGHSSLYLSGEESEAQVRARASRLGLAGRGVQLLAEQELEALAPELQRLQPAVVAVDSIQTAHTREHEALPGTVTQVRACAAQFIQWAKTTGGAVLLIGHVTKEGALAGPRTLEHMVDVVLYLEGLHLERSASAGEDLGASAWPQRLLRCTKNRFGAAHEVGLFAMTAAGLAAVDNPSSLLLRERTAGAPGTAVFAGMEGTRPLLVEIQALVSDGPGAAPRRMAQGVDPQRVGLLQAVVEKHLGLSVAGLDVFVNVVGGLRLAEPALDAALVAALLSSLRNKPLPPNLVVFGEVGLAGEVRSVRFAAERLAEAARLGFTHALLPPLRHREPLPLPAGLTAQPVATVKELAAALDEAWA